MKHRNKRLGAAIVEMAICLPVIVLLTFGTIELASGLFLKQTLTSAAHEGALAGMRLDATEASVRDRVELILAVREVEDCVITITPSGSAFDAMQSGDTFTIQIDKDSENTYVDFNSVSVSVSTQHP